jgi:hypothetical protein
MLVGDRLHGGAAPVDLRAYVIHRFSLEAVGPLYSRYFDRIA